MCRKCLPGQKNEEAFYEDLSRYIQRMDEELKVCLLYTSGVAGGSLLLIPMACSLFGISDDISMQVVAVGFIIGVVQDSVETALNSSSDLLLSASAEFRQWRMEGKEIKFK